MPRLTRKKRLTKKVGGNKNVQDKPKTIPQLRRLFEEIDKKVKENPNMSVSEFQKLWKSKFGKSIGEKEAASYLELQAKTKSGGGKGTRKNKKQTGGSAPIDYTLRPGLDGTHGSYLPYVSSGLSFYDNINKIAMDADCGKIDTTPQISSGMGSNEIMKGGQRMFPASIPAGLGQDFESHRLSIPLSPGSSVLDISNRFPRV